MNEAGFRELLATEAYDGPSVFEMDGNAVTKEHVHATDIVALVVEGSITIERRSGSTTYNVGDTFGYAAGEPHAEIAGADGVRVLVGKRSAAAPPAA